MTHGIRQVSDICNRICHQSRGTNSPLYRCFRPTGDDSRLRRYAIGHRLRTDLGGDVMKKQRDVSAMLRLKARGWGLRRIAVKLRCSRNTVRRWLVQGERRPHPSRSTPNKLDGLSDWLRECFRLHAGNTNAVRQELARDKNITVSLRTVERAVAPLWREFFLVERARQVAFEWMRSVLQKDIGLDVLRGEIGDVSEIEILLRRLYEGRLSDRNRSLAVLANRRGVSSRFVLRLPWHQQEHASQIPPVVRRWRLRCAVLAPDQGHTEVQ